MQLRMEVMSAHSLLASHQPRMVASCAQEPRSDALAPPASNSRTQACHRSQDRSASKSSLWLCLSKIPSHLSNRLKRPNNKLLRMLPP
jgi:hypothetical protein